MSRTILLVLFLLTGSVVAQQPAPLSKQLRLGCLARASLDTTLQNWIADHFVWVDGFGASEGARIRGRNPNFEFNHYNLFMRTVSDTGNIRAWAVANSINYDSLFMRTGPTAADSVVMRFASFPSAFGASFRTTPGGGYPIQFNGYGTDTRVWWDYRNPNVGKYLGRALCEFMRSEAPYNDNLFLDEWSLTGFTGLNIAGLYILPYPAYDTTSGCWSTPWRNVVNPWPTSMNEVSIRDSLRVLLLAENQWADIMCDSLINAGFKVVYNPSSSYGPYNSMTNWDNEGLSFTVNQAKSIFMGEICYYTPAHNPGADASPNESYLYCTNASEGCRDLANTGSSVYIWPIMGGFSDSSATDTFTIAQGNQAALGFMLDCLSPGSEYNFAFRGLIKVDWGYMSELAAASTRDGNPYPTSPYLPELHDSVLTWNNSFGKYFGVPNTTRTTSSGTDAAGQSYTLRRWSLDKPNGDTLTLVVGRYARGANRKPWGSRVSYTLPSWSSSGGDQWFELQANGTYLTTKVEGDTVSIRNGGFRFFTTDTTMMNNGPDDTLLTIQSSKSHTEGNSGTSQVSIIFSLSKSLGSNLTYTINTANVSATAGSDYTAISGGTGTVEAGDTADTILVTISGDTDVESDETFTVTISSPSLGQLGSATVCTVTISNDDSAPAPATTVGWKGFRQ